MLWIPVLDVLHSDPGMCQMFPGPVYVVGFLGWMTYIMTLVFAQCFQNQCKLWIPGLNDLYSDLGIFLMFPGAVYAVDSWAGCPTFWPWYLSNVSRTSVCYGFLCWMSYILTLVSAQCLQYLCMLWVSGLDVLHFDPGIYPMFPGPVYVVDSFAGCPTFWHWYLPNVSRTSVCCGFLCWMSYILTLVSTQCF